MTQLVKCTTKSRARGRSLHYMWAWSVKMAGRPSSTGSPGARRWTATAAIRRWPCQAPDWSSRQVHCGSAAPNAWMETAWTWRWVHWKANRGGRPGQNAKRKTERRTKRLVGRGWGLALLKHFKPVSLCNWALLTFLKKVPSFFYLKTLSIIVRLSESNGTCIHTVHATIANLLID
jgi:hypothetical protein